MAVIKMQDYDFMFNNDEEVVLVLNGIGGLAKEPFFTVRNTEAMLFRSPDSPQIALDRIPAAIREKLQEIPQILVCELDADGEPQQVYDVPVLKNA